MECINIIGNLQDELRFFERGERKIIKIFLFYILKNEYNY